MISSYKLLTIDPSESSLETVKDVVIRHPEFQVTHLDSATLIYELMHYQVFDLAFLDSPLAKADDFRLVRSLKEAYPKTGIVLLTGAYDDRFSMEALDAGADSFFTKPMTYEKFALTLERGYWKALNRLDWWESNEPKIPVMEDLVF